MKILFVHLPSIPSKFLRESMRTKSKHEVNLSFPLGILYLSSYVKAHCQLERVALLDYPLYVRQNIRSYETIEAFILGEARKHVDFKPDIIAFSLMFSASHHFFTLAAQAMKSLYPDALNIVGGVHATNTSKVLLGMDHVDHVVRGQGEVALSRIVSSLAKGEPIMAKGVYSAKDRALSSHDTLAEFIEDLDAIPFPDWSLLEMENYLLSDQRRYTDNIKDKRMATIIATRGCPYKCSYCSGHTVHGRNMRYRSVENIIAEMTALHDRYGVTLFVFFDDLFTAKKNRVLALLARIRELDIPGLELQFPNALHVNTLDEEIVDALVGCGVKVFNLAIETGTEYMQKIIKKSCDLNKARVIIDYCRKKGVMVRCNFIFGFPGETMERMREGVRYMRTIRADWFNLYMATPLVGSEMYDQFVEKGYIADDETTWDQGLVQDRGFDTEEVSAAELKEFIDRTNIELNFLNNSNNVEGKFDNAMSLFKDIVKHYPFQIFAYYGMALSCRGKKDDVSADLYLNEMKKVIDADPRAADLFHKYQDLLPVGVSDERHQAI